MVSANSKVAGSLPYLSVLALSSRFDGLGWWRLGKVDRKSFQYSLCRVVLMVTHPDTEPGQQKHLSVLALSSRFDGPGQEYSRADSVRLSVLALSSRFDGQPAPAGSILFVSLSVLALSSRFDGPEQGDGYTRAR